MPQPSASPTRMLIVSDVPLVSWGIQSSLVGLPGVTLTLEPPDAPPGSGRGEVSPPEVVVAAPGCPHQGLCRRLRRWNQEQGPATVVCLAPDTTCPRGCPVDLIVPLEHIGPAALRLLLRQAAGEAQASAAPAPEVGERLTPCPEAVPLAPGFPISAREREIGLLVTAGYSSLEIGRRLYISRRTVEKHRANLMDKLGVSNAAALARELLYLCWTEGDTLIAA